MRKPRKPYVPRPVNHNPLGALRPATVAEQAPVMTRFLSAIDAMVRGENPGRPEWRDLSDAVNTVETLAKTGKLVAAEVLPMVLDATNAMVRAAHRFHDGAGARLDGPGLQALRDIVDVYQQCLDGFTHMEMAQAQAETERRVRAAAKRVNAGQHEGHEVISL